AIGPNQSAGSGRNAVLALVHEPVVIKRRYRDEASGFKHGLLLIGHQRQIAKAQQCPLGCLHIGCDQRVLVVTLDAQMLFDLRQRPERPELGDDDISHCQSFLAPDLFWVAGSALFFVVGSFLAFGSARMPASTRCATSRGSASRTSPL